MSGSGGAVKTLGLGKRVGGVKVGGERLRAQINGGDFGPVDDVGGEFEVVAGVGGAVDADGCAAREDGNELECGRLGGVGVHRYKEGICAAHGGHAVVRDFDANLRAAELRGGWRPIESSAGCVDGCARGGGDQSINQGVGWNVGINGCADNGEFGASD